MRSIVSHGGVSVIPRGVAGRGGFEISADEFLKPLGFGLGPLRVSGWTLEGLEGRVGGAWKKGLTWSALQDVC